MDSVEVAKINLLVWSRVMQNRKYFWGVFCGICLAISVQVSAREPLKALIIDGQNNHGIWPKTTQMMKRYLLESGKFEVDIATTAA